MRALVLTLTFAFISMAVACATSQESPAPDIPATVAAQVQATVAAIPTATPRPTYTPYPTPASHLQLTTPPELTLEELVKATFDCMQKNPSMKAGFIAGIVEELPDSEELANRIANEFEIYEVLFLSGGDDAETREGLELMHATCLTVAE